MKTLSLLSALPLILAAGCADASGDVVAADTVGADHAGHDMSATSDSGVGDAGDAGDASAGDANAVGPDVADPPDVADDSAFAKYRACFPHLVDAISLEIEFDAEVSDTCAGTAHQDIDDVDKLVIMGDSISDGAGASSNVNAYFSILHASLETHFGHSIELVNCAVGGAVNSGLVGQINNCFTAQESMRTLVVFTSGGNDIANMAFSKLSTADGLAAVDTMVGHLDAAVAMFDDTTRWPEGVFVVFADVYEYTDATANMSSCPLAALGGLSGTWEAGLPVFAYMTSEYGRIAAEYGRDVIFMEETFCGHGFAADSPESPCNEVAGDNWFSFDCIHPNNAGHKAIADLFYSVVTQQPAP